jgi:hypothetical protein
MRFKTKLGAGLAVATVVAAGAWAAIGTGGPADATDVNGQATATGPTVPGGTWGPAQPVPGVAALAPSGYTPGSTSLTTITCTAAGTCTAVGSYEASKSGIITQWPVVVSETAGTWGNAQLVSSTDDLGTGTTASLSRVSCGAAGDCTAAGLFAGTDGKSHGFLVTEAAGTWGTATAIDDSGLGASLVTGVAALSCRAAGDCTAVGTYAPDSGTTIVPRAFTMDESNGVWGAPQPVTGQDALLSATGSSFIVQSLSCGAPGDCTMGGTAEDGTGGEPFLASESGGTWGDARAVPGFQSLPGASNGSVLSMSCPDNGDCAAVGIYATATSSLPYTIDEAGGTWGTAHPLSLPSGATLASAPKVACWSAGNCTATGEFHTTGYLPFAAIESGGTWGTARLIPGLPAGTTGSSVTALSCAPAGECTILGWYSAPAAAFQEFTATVSASGSVGTAQPLPAAYSRQRSTIALSCPQSGYCALVTGPSGNLLVSEATAATVTLKASAPAITYGSEQSETLTATVSSPAGGTPTGTVTVTDGTATACVITLQTGTGTCTLDPTVLPSSVANPGDFDTLTATYSGDASYLSATSTTGVTVAQGRASVSFTFSPAAVTYTSKGLTFTFTISVTAAGGPPEGVADGIIYSSTGGGTCQAALAGGKATCSTTVPLKGGRYGVVVSYGGSPDFRGATSAPQYLTVARAKTSTGLTLSKATITYGHENAERLTVSASHLSGSYSTGKVTIKAGTTVLCTISLSKSGGSCVLSTTRLKAGTYRLTATYSGDVNYAPSTSVVRVLKVVA